jgi:hypothetical protein
MKWQARLAGAKIEDDTEQPSAKADPETPLFGDPEEYKLLSKDKRRALTKKMREAHANLPFFRKG